AAIASSRSGTIAPSLNRLGNTPTFSERNESLPAPISLRPRRSRMHLRIAIHPGFFRGASGVVYQRCASHNVGKDPDPGVSTERLSTLAADSLTINRPRKRLA